MEAPESSPAQVFFFLTLSRALSLSLSLCLGIGGHLGLYTGLIGLSLKRNWVFYRCLLCMLSVLGRLVVREELEGTRRVCLRGCSVCVCVCV